MRLVGLALLALLVGSSLSVQAQTLQSVKFGLVKMTGSIPMWIGTDMGYYTEEGLKPDLNYFGASVEVATAVVSGDVDIGSAGFTAALYNLGAKNALSVIAAQLRDAPGYHLNALVATKAAYDKGFTRITDLPGKRIAVTEIGSSPHYFIAMMAKKYGFDLSKVEIVALQSLQNQNAAFAGGQVDGGILSGSAANQFVANGQGKIIAWTGDEVAWQTGGQVVRPRFIKEHPDIIEKFVRGYRKSLALYGSAVQHAPSGELIKGPKFEEVIGIISKNIGIAPDKLPDILPSFDTSGNLDIPSMKTQAAFFQQLGLVDKSANVDAMTDTSFLAKASK